MSTVQPLQIQVTHISHEHARSLGIPETPQSTGGWSPWECDKSIFEWDYTCAETAYLYEGRVKIKTLWDEVEIKRGDLVVFPTGLKCTWNVLEPVRKVYSFEEA